MSEETNMLIIEETDESVVNITLLNLAVAGNDGIAALRDLIKNDPSAVVALLIPEDMDNPDVIIEVVKAGAKAYIKKPTSVEEINGRLTRLLKREEEK